MTEKIAHYGSAGPVVFRFDGSDGPQSDLVVSHPRILPARRGILRGVERGDAGALHAEREEHREASAWHGSGLAATPPTERHPRGDRSVVRAHDDAVRATPDWVEETFLKTRGWDPETG